VGEQPRTLPPRLAASTPYLVTRVVRGAARLAQDWFADEPLRFGHFVTLCWVEHLGRCTQRELAEAMDSDPSDLVTVLSAVEAAELLTRRTDPDDRRRNLLDVTDAGREWLRARQDRALAYDSALCAALPDGGAVLRDQLAALLSLLPSEPR
jgi:MarR family transcriptional regulator, lower aerobic nicotinate degradation pathway regulator